MDPPTRPGRCRSAGAPATPAPLDEAIEAARIGSCVGIFPEGRVSDDPGQGLQRIRSGLTRIAMPSGAPVVPVGIWGTQEVWPRAGSRAELAAAAPHDGGRLRRRRRAAPGRVRPRTSASGTARRSRRSSRVPAPSPATSRDPFRRHAEPVVADRRERSPTRTPGSGVPRRRRPTRRETGCLRRRASSNARGGRRRDRRPGPGAARRTVPIHPRPLLLGDPRGRRADRRRPARRRSARARRGDRLPRRRLARARAVLARQLDLGRDGRAVPRHRPARGEADPDETEELAVRWLPFDDALASRCDPASCSTR